MSGDPAAEPRRDRDDRPATPAEPDGGGGDDDGDWEPFEITRTIRLPGGGDRDE